MPSIRSACGVEMIGEKLVSSRQVGPGRTSANSAMSRSTISSRSRRCDDQARAGDADLAGIAEDRGGDLAGGAVGARRVGEDQLRALAAELQRHRLRPRWRRWPP